MVKRPFLRSWRSCGNSVLASQESKGQEGPVNVKTLIQSSEKGHVEGTREEIQGARPKE